MRRVLAGTGKTLITLGILILLFVAYQLWGTGIYTARAQNKLENEFQAVLHQSGGGGTTDFPTVSTRPIGLPTTTTPVTTTTEPAIDAPGTDAIAHIVIPKIDVDKIVVAGVDEADLRRGPGHYPQTPLPGQAGNAAIAGHRTTYGAPFGDLDQLEVGDEIRIRTVEGTFKYIVYDKFAVSPDASEVLDPDPTRAATLTLTTCTPKYSASQRLIIKADLVLPSGAAPLPATVDPATANTGHTSIAGDGLSGTTGSRTPTALVGLLLLLVGGLWWLLFHRHPRWTTWLIGAIPFGIVLFTFYFLLERVLPANY